MKAEQTQAKVDELKTLFAQLQEKESAQIKGRYGVNLSEIIEQILAAIKSLDIGNLAGEGLHALIHFLIDTVLPKLKETSPLWAKLAIDHIVIPLLKKLDEGFHPPTPA